MVSFLWYPNYLLEYCLVSIIVLSKLTDRKLLHYIKLLEVTPKTCHRSPPMKMNERVIWTDGSMLCQFWDLYYTLKLWLNYQLTNWTEIMFAWNLLSLATLTTITYIVIILYDRFIMFAHMHVSMLIVSTLVELHSIY